ncbi:acyl-CoA dehydrogenase [Pseudomonas alkylphenolica]|uniref:Acyl-CoA dehydrogenase n=1 Tax=Pseudomonas alkylphenolica TaxID=237609 RepID=A0A6I6H5X1_9PSED|nr:acyl-CoA dehydrogenase family protein [Pseudomonas alkylphenolica]QGW77521.1 acyl-CoA dehydrogenase [Pseudomonas alkylphenolica]
MNQAPNTYNNDAQAPSELQQMITHSVQGLFAELVSPEVMARFDTGQPPSELWQPLVDHGLTAALMTEAAGGSAASWLEASPILHALGYWNLPLPLSETMLAGLLLSRAGLQVPEGPISLIQTGRLGDLQLSADGQLDGRCLNVPWARSCQWAAMADCGGRIALVDLRQIGVKLTAGTNFAGEERDSLEFTNVPVQAIAPLQVADVCEPVWLFGALARACMLVGALESSLDQALAYANQRVQFGKPIGTFQALQQQLAHAAGSIAAASASTQIALHSAGLALSSEAGQPTSLTFDVAVAKVCAGEAATLVTSIVHQVHGAIGFTHEHSLHYSTRRLWSWRDEFGSDAQWAEVLGQSAISAGSQGFWAALTARDLPLQTPLTRSSSHAAA